MADYTPPHGLSVSIDLGKGGYTPPSSLTVSINLTVKTVIPDVQSVGGAGTGWESLAPGVPGIRHRYRTISFAGLGVQSNYGVFWIKNAQQFSKPIGLSSFLAGKPSIINKTKVLHLSGIIATAYGTARLQLLRSYIQAPSINSELFSKPRISYKEQRATVGPMPNMTFYGRPTLTHGVRTVRMVGSDLSRYGNMWLSFKVRNVAPVGTLMQKLGVAKALGTRHINAFGSDFSRFGSRIIPESQTVYPLGFTGMFGQASIDNMRRYLQPKGFRLTEENPDWRYGRSEVFNLTQYIVQTNKPDDGTNPPKIGDGGMVTNRNREIMPIGYPQQKFGYQELNNNARLLEPSGIPSPIEVEAIQTFIAEKVRRIRPDSIEAPYMSDYSIIWLNAKRVYAKGSAFDLFGMPHFENTRRNFRFIGMGEQSQFGHGMISHAVRGISFQSDYSIHPPVIPLPEVKLGTRYVEPAGIDSVRYGWFYVAERFNKISPRWIPRDYVGEPVIRNKTPQVKMWSADSNVFGKSYIGLYKRDIQTAGLNSQIFGVSRISDRKQLVDFRGYGIASMSVSRTLKIEKLSSDLYATQQILPRGFSTKNFDEWRYPSVHQNVLRPASERAMTLFGNIVVTANSIRVEPGYWEVLMGKPAVQYKNRTVRVISENNDFLAIGKPRMSPFTIWAVKEAPTQAISNHVKPNLRLHYVDGLNASGYEKEPGIEIGTPSIYHYHRKISPWGFSNLAIGTHEIDNTQYVIKPKGWLSLRIGVIAPLGDQTISFRPKDVQTLFGNAGIGHVQVQGNQIKPIGFSLSKFGQSYIDYFHRNIKPTGFNSQKFGTSKENDKPYMWQGLRVGAHVPTKITGGDFSLFGKSWISLHTREIIPMGEDSSLVGEYTPGLFNLKMVIYNRNQAELPKFQLVKGAGFIAQQIGTPNIKPSVHFIRPDGNSDHYRKGGF